MFNLHERIDNLLEEPRHQLSRGARFLRTQVELWRFCARRLHENNLGAMSAALSFRTIFALIPTLVLTFLVLKSMGIIEDGKRALREVLDTSGFAQVVAVETVNPEGEDETAATEPRVVTAADQIERLVDDVERQLTFARIGPIGALVMIWTAMTLLTTLESSLNRIFGAPRSRALTHRVIMFWSALTLGPVLIMAAVFAGGSAIHLAETLPGIGWLVKAVGWLTPAVVGVLVVAAGYKLIPNTHVRFRAAIGGAIVAVPAWMVARWAFAIYVERFVVEGNLYGVLGLLPLFLIWLNVSWSIFLFGAELAHTATSLRQLRRGENAENLILGPSDWLAVATAIARRFLAGEAPPGRADLVEETGLPPEAVQRMLDPLLEAGLITATASEPSGYLLPRPAEQIPLVAILDLADPRQPVGADASGAPLGGIRADLANRTLADLCDPPDRAASPATRLRLP